MASWGTIVVAIVVILFILILLGLVLWYFFSSGFSSPVPRNLQGRLEGTNLSLSWDRVNGARDYNVYIGTVSGQYDPPRVVQTNTFGLSNVTPCSTYYVTVTSVVDGVESARAREIVVTGKPRGTRVIQNGLERNGNNLNVRVEETGATSYVARVGPDPQNMTLLGRSDGGVPRIVVDVSRLQPCIPIYVSVASVLGPDCMSDYSPPVIYTPVSPPATTTPILRYNSTGPTPGLNATWNPVAIPDPRYQLEVNTSGTWNPVGEPTTQTRGLINIPQNQRAEVRVRTFARNTCTSLSPVAVYTPIFSNNIIV